MMMIRNQNVKKSILFGIGVMILPNKEGLKKITTGSFSQGCGIGGIGALFINGPALLDGNRYVALSIRADSGG